MIYGYSISDCLCISVLISCLKQSRQTDYKKEKKLKRSKIKLFTKLYVTEILIVV